MKVAVHWLLHPLPDTDDPEVRKRVVWFGIIVNVVLFVALGCPKQERFIAKFKDRLGVRCAMGIGGAMFEHIDFADGKIETNRLARYRLPRFADMPVIESVLLDRKDLPSAGAGETPIMGVAPAVGNAIFDATGIRIRSLPMVPKGLPAPGAGGTGTSASVSA